MSGEGVGSLPCVRLVAEELSRDDGAFRATFEPILEHSALRVDEAMTGLVTAASKIAFKCKRSRRLCARDVERAIRMEYKGEENTVFFVSDQAKPIVTSEEQGLFCFQEPEVDLKEYVQESFAPLPRTPIAPTFAIHWLVIDGVQPSIPENDISNLAGDVSDAHTLQKKRNASSAVGLSETAHADDSAVLTKELALYLDKVTSQLVKVEGVVGGDVSVHDKARYALTCLENDAGIDRLVPHFVRFISNHVKLHLKQLPALWTAVRISHALVHNGNLHNVDLYLHELLPALLSCVVSKALGASPGENHWSVREAAARLIADVCHKFGRLNADLQPRVVEIYNEALSSRKPLTTQFGGVVGLAALGPIVVNNLLVPLLKRDQYLDKLERAANGSLISNGERMSDAQFEKSYEAFKVLHALRDVLSQGSGSIILDRYVPLNHMGYEWSILNQQAMVFI